MDSDEVDDQAGAVAGDGDVTTSVPPQTDAGPDLACTQDNTDEPTRHPWRAAWATAGVLALGAVILVAAAGIVGWALWPTAQPRRPATLPLPTATSRVQAAPPTVATPTPSTAAPETTPAAE